MRIGKIKRVLMRTLVLAVWSALSTSHADQSLAIGEHAALPAGSARVPVQMADAAGVATTAFIVNFDPDLLSLTNVTAGGLGTVFALEYNLEEGRVAVALVRDEALVAGAGTLVYLDFTVNSGAVPGMTAPLAIADGTASGKYSVDLASNQIVVHSNGVVRVVSLTQDSNADGLPDWWEELYFEGPTSANASLDSDSDGMKNGQEYLAGTNPQDSASVLRVTSATFDTSGFKVSFPTVQGVVYRVLRSDELSSWVAVGADVPGTGTVAEVLDPAAPNASARYYRIMVVH